MLIRSPVTHFNYMSHSVAEVQWQTAVGGNQPQGVTAWSVFMSVVAEERLWELSQSVCWKEGDSNLLN